MQREIMTSIPFLSQSSAEALNTPEDLAVAQDLQARAYYLQRSRDLESLK